MNGKLFDLEKLFVEGKYLHKEFAIYDLREMEIAMSAKKMQIGN